MSFNFGGFDLSSLGNLTDIGDTLQKLKEDVEQTFENLVEQNGEDNSESSPKEQGNIVFG